MSTCMIRQAANPRLEGLSCDRFSLSKLPCNSTPHTAKHCHAAFTLQSTPWMHGTDPWTGPRWRSSRHGLPSSPVHGRIFIVKQVVRSMSVLRLPVCPTSVPIVVLDELFGARCHLGTLRFQTVHFRVRNVTTAS